MKLLDVLPLFEARKNPTLNQRIPSYQELKNLVDSSDDPDNLYISFTDIEKIGLNPLSEFDTPLGIYCYHIKSAFEFYKVHSTKSLLSLPYASDKPNIQIIKWNGTGKVFNIDEYSTDDLNNDIKRIKKIFPNSNIFKPDIKSSEDVSNTIASGFTNARNRSLPASQFFSICKELTEVSDQILTHDIWLSKSNKESKDFNVSISARKWNTLLRKLGYALFIDHGKSVIHPLEKNQAFFTSTKYLTRVDMLRNYATVDLDKIENAIHNNAIGLINSYLNDTKRPDLIQKYPQILHMDIRKQNFGILKKFCKLLNITLDKFITFPQMVHDDLDQAINCYNNGIVSYNHNNAQLMVDSLNHSNYNTNDELKSIIRNNKQWSSFFKPFLGK
jgi:hypothetical protein